MECKTTKSKSFEFLKKEIKDKLKEIKNIQNEIEESLRKSKEFSLRLSNIEEITNKLNNLKTDIISKTNLGINSIINNIEDYKSNSIEVLKDKINILLKNNNPH